MKRKRRILRCLLALLCVLGILLPTAAFLLIDRGTPAPSVDDESIWQILHVYKGTWHDDALTRFVFLKNRNTGLALDVHGYFIDDIIYCIFPQGTDLSRLCLNFTADEPLFVNGKKVISGLTRLDLSQPAAVECGERSYRLECRFTQLPVLELKTTDEQPPIPYSGEKAAVFNLYDPSGRLLVNDTARIRVRGNSTAALSKLPIRLETSHSHALLQLQEDDAWALLANFMDPTLMRNQVAFDLAEALGMEYVPQQEYVELYLNGQYQGVYTITTQLGIRSGSVDLPPISQNRPEGSYLLEFDVRSAGDPDAIITPLGVPIVIDSPSSVSDALREDIREEVLRLEAAITAPGGALDGVRYTQLIDLNSLAGFFLVSELTYNGDVRKPLSVFMYKAADGKFHMGPVWDYDLSQGLSPREAEEDATVIMLEDSWWWPYLLRDEEFLRAVAEKMAMLPDWYAQEDERLNRLSLQLEGAAENNFIVSYIGVNDYCNTLADNSFDEEMAGLRAWLPKRFEAFDDALPALMSSCD